MEAVEQQVAHRGRQKRSLALFAVCLGVLMTSIDTTIIAVALPWIVADLHLSEMALSWTLNAYLLTFGGFLILCGRLSDLYGRRFLFLVGVGLFTLASLACGVARSPLLFV